MILKMIKKDLFNALMLQKLRNTIYEWLLSSSENIHHETKFPKRLNTMTIYIST